MLLFNQPLISDHNGACKLDLIAVLKINEFEDSTDPDSRSSYLGREAMSPLKNFTDTNTHEV